MPCFSLIQPNCLQLSKVNIVSVSFEALKPPNETTTLINGRKKAPDELQADILASCSPDKRKYSLRRSFYALILGQPKPKPPPSIQLCVSSGSHNSIRNPHHHRHASIAPLPWRLYIYNSLPPSAHRSAWFEDVSPCSLPR